MMGNTLPRLLLQLIAPLFQLPGDDLDTADLLDAPRLDVRGVTVVALRFGQFHDGVGGVVVDAFTEHPQHFDGGA
jgi:hypothetical protein